MLSEETVASLEKDYNDIEAKQGWHLLYHALSSQEIRTDAQQFDFTCKDAKRLENRSLNRYRDVNPYDHARIKLGRGQVDYINASLVEIPAARRRYILTQGPLPNTTGHFWLLVWEQCSRAIIMLNKTIEKNQIKCHQYWPLVSGAEDRLQLEDVGLTVELVSQTDCSYYTVSALKLTDQESGEHREVLHYHYTTWPDFGIPQSPHAFLMFLAAVREAGVLEESVGPAVVHCSAGIGRSGTFSLVDSYLLMLERGCVDGQSIQSVLLTMRRYRMGLIQTHEQLKFSYQAIVQGARSLLKHNALCDMLNGSGASPQKRKLAANDDSDDETPPPPPPRTESLKRSKAVEESRNADLNNEEHLSDSTEEEAPQPQPQLAPCAGLGRTAGDGESAISGTADRLPRLVDAPLLNDGGLRQRRVRKAQLEQRVEEMRRRQLEHELWQRRKQQLRPLGYTAAALGGAVLVYLMWSRWL
ncbi:tyrosine-protein phosphatase non-receptor type 2-like isoform X2 [Amphibalanus amphitrite]|uniref:tyrosine-protein phosphatase non-receptor type 2-like isoform X2 n=1 Tax=Amphibalanus amphitrite TaxID=1232801 RepID=UPI001C90359B|nr:tyrosine-protein phosphatase non-receptor type 2-like isoform X2 [Amphibalanus amphitrite]